MGAVSVLVIRVHRRDAADVVGHEGEDVVVDHRLTRDDELPVPEHREEGEDDADEAEDAEDAQHDGSDDGTATPSCCRLLYSLDSIDSITENRGSHNRT